jgi:hypothetical protein
MRIATVAILYVTEAPTVVLMASNTERGIREA